MLGDFFLDICKTAKSACCEGKLVTCTDSIRGQCYNGTSFPYRAIIYTCVFSFFFN